MADDGAFRLRAGVSSHTDRAVLGVETLYFNSWKTFLETREGDSCMLCNRFLVLVLCVLRRRVVGDLTLSLNTSMLRTNEC